ncbi:MAG TPA: HpsJ family protein [Nodosilinea sp.]|nr:HpsJ family protein [Nodosilinea sp.]
MATLSARNTSNTNNASVASSLCLIVGLACLAGFAVDLFILAVPPSPRSIQWRVGVMQQVADRSIVLLFGMALTYYGTLASRSWRKLIPYICLAMGALFLLSGLFVLRDSSKLHSETIGQIETQAAQIKTQIEQATANPQLAPDVTPEQIRQASDILVTRESELKANTKQSILKAGVSTVGNLVVIGLSFLGLGLFGSRAARF